MANDKIAAELVEYIIETYPTAKEYGPLPVDQSLHELGILDSYAIIELVDYIERNWNIKILDSEITKEKFGGIEKMATLISEKTNRR